MKTEIYDPFGEEVPPLSLCKCKLDYDLFGWNACEVGEVFKYIKIKGKWYIIGLDYPYEWNTLNAWFNGCGISNYKFKKYFEIIS